MTARNRLRKRAAQKAKVPNFGIKNSKPDIIPQNVSIKNPPDDRNNHTSNSTVLTSKPISTENNANKASTAARINPISNQVQTVVISNSCNSESEMNHNSQMISNQGKF